MNFNLIIQYNTVVIVAWWLDGRKFGNSKQGLKRPAVVRYTQVPKYLQHVIKPKTVKG
jgi:hypothetical protein